MNAVTINRADLLAALDLFERQLADDPNAAVSFSTITNPTHALDPIGAGFAVTVHAYGAVAFEKSYDSFTVAMERALTRVIRSSKKPSPAGETPQEKP